MTARTPTFFIVGAPKAGTTAWYTYLKAHPDVFLPSEKELHHFSTDLVAADYPLLRDDFYLSMFQSVPRDHLVGQVAVFDLFSTTSAANIRKFCPEAKIIIMVRNPVDLMYSLHSQLRYNGHEDIPDFGEALAAEPLRRTGQLAVPESPIKNVCFYREVARLPSQIDRYLHQFPRDQVHFVVFDDLEDDTAGAFAVTLRFLGLPPISQDGLETVNPNKDVRSGWLRDVLLRHPPPWLRRAARLVDATPRHELMRIFARMNTRYVPRPRLDPALRARLAAELAPEIDALSVIVDRDLSHWYTSVT